jgi:hypothetical protein
LALPRGTTANESNIIIKTNGGKENRNQKRLAILGILQKYKEGWLVGWLCAHRATFFKMTTISDLK